MSVGGNHTGLRRVRNQENPDLPWRSFKDRPTLYFIEDVLKHLQETAQPEILESLYRNPIAKNEKFQILKSEIQLAGTKRPLGDNAPCPMCTPNRFLSCSLVYLPRLQACAVIGHCCADKGVAAEAEREYRLRRKKDHEEGYLLTHLPLVEARMAVLRSLEPAATEALRLYRLLRKDHPPVHALLRQVKHEYRGRLVLSEIIRGGEEGGLDNDYEGPRGFRGRGGGALETRDHDFGLLTGTLAVAKDYNPVADLNTLRRQLGSVPHIPTEEAALDFIVTLSKAERHATFTILKWVGEGVSKFTTRIKEFLSFITPENAAVLNAFGTSEHNSLYFTAEYLAVLGRPSLHIRYDRLSCRLNVGPQFDALEYDWPLPMDISPAP